jgi:hypothetical protein
MRKPICVFLFLMIMVPSLACAKVSGEGSLSFDFSGFPSVPAPEFYQGSSMYYGQILYYDTADVFAPKTYPWDSQGYVAMTSPGYSDPGTSDGSSHVSGQWTRATGAFNFSYAAVDNHPGSVATQVRGLHSNSFRFRDFTELPAFSYSYSFSSNKDAVNESFAHIIQMEVGYVNDSGASVALYSDYSSSAPEFRTKWVKSDSFAGQDIMDITESGTYSFGGYQFDGQKRTWYVSYDFGMRGNSPVDVVPEPISSTLFLLGAGAFLLRGRSKKGRS